MAQEYFMRCTFESWYRNPLTGRRGRYRVTGGALQPLFETDDERKEFIDRFACPANVMWVRTSRRYRKGSIISPTKEVARVLAARRGAAHLPTRCG